MKLRDLHEVRVGSRHDIQEEFGSTNKGNLASSLVEPIYGLMKYGSYNGKWDKRYLHRAIFRDAKSDPLVLNKYREFKSSFGLFAFLSWPIFKTVLSWVIWFIINNYLLEE